MLELAFACMGFCWIIKDGWIFEKPREFLSRWKFFRKLFECSLCVGGEIGIVFVLFGQPWWFIGFSAAVCYIGDTILNYIQGLDQKLGL